MILSPDGTKSEPPADSQISISNKHEEISDPMSKDTDSDDPFKFSFFKDVSDRLSNSTRTLLIASKTHEEIGSTEPKEADSTTLAPIDDDPSSIRNRTRTLLPIQTYSLLTQAKTSLG